MKIHNIVKGDKYEILCSVRLPRKFNKLFQTE